ncbi:replication protein A 70 kDa DNA-binding subunit B-like [Daucus carota subsp. sativus]|uniref:replication protein A 70 kDa DNA-binding subunit B-like n=1 Tax=Daucus carota subsp. sativus TaxID=79200 RepID=UPI00308375A7
MESTRFDCISMLTSNKTDWKIKVRMTRLWKSINSKTGDFKGYNMILLDDDKTHIHAFAGLEFVNGIDEVPEEGKIYETSEFNVADAKYSYSPVSNKKEIYFLKRTNMKLIEEEDDMIPQHKFELVAFNALKEKVGNTKILTDLMGLVENILPMQSRNTATGPKDILMFDISDGSAKVKVTVWAELAHKLQEELQKANTEQIIIILTSCGITTYQKQLQASTLSPSKFYINPDYDAVYPLRNRLNGVNEPTVVEDTPSVPDCLKKTIPTYNLKQITDLRNSDPQTLEVICHVSVCDVDAQSKWWFYSCDSCPGELSFINNTYNCEECAKIVSYPDKRFKLAMYVTDPTETIQVFMFDREVRRLISTTVNSLIGQNLKEGKGQHFPEKLKDIIGKTLKLTLSLNTNNLIHGKTVYFASDVFEGVETTLNQNTTSSSEINAMVQDPPLNVDVVTKDMQPPSTKRTRNNDDGHNEKKKT